MDFRLLGPVTVVTGERRHSPGRPKHRLLLAVLLAAGGKEVTTDRLIDCLWDDHPPETARNLVYQLVSELRGNLNRAEPGAADLLPKRGSGYLARVDPERVDVHRFQTLARSGHKLTNDDSEAVKAFREALAEWGDGLRGGEPLSDVNGNWANNYRLRLQEDHRAALIACLTAELRLGRHSQLIPELTDHVNADPADETVRGLLMLALYRSGRQPDALNEFQRIRQLLDDDFGSPVGKDLDDLQQRILRQDPGLDLTTPSRSPVVAADGVATPSSSSATQNPNEADMTTPNSISRQIEPIMHTGRRPQPFAILVFDIDRFGERREPVQKLLRERSYALVRGAFDAAGIEHASAPVHDRGDGAFWLLPPSAARADLMDRFIASLQAGLRAHAEANDDEAVIRLRIALHAGVVTRDEHGWSGPDLTVACRLCDAKPLRDTLASARRATFAVAVSRRWYEDVIRHGAGTIDRHAYRPVMVMEKELVDVAWIHVPGYDTPPGLDGYAKPSAGEDPAAGAEAEPGIVINGGWNAFTGARIKAGEVVGRDSIRIDTGRDNR